MFGACWAVALAVAAAGTDDALGVAPVAPALVDACWMIAVAGRTSVADVDTPTLNVGVWPDGVGEVFGLDACARIDTGLADCKALLFGRGAPLSPLICKMGWGCSWLSVSVITELSGILAVVCKTTVPYTVCTCNWFFPSVARTTPSMFVPRARFAISADGVTSVAVLAGLDPPEGGCGGGGGETVVMAPSIYVIGKTYFNKILAILSTSCAASELG